jgi:acetyl esterase/lipase
MSALLFVLPRPFPSLPPGDVGATSGGPSVEPPASRPSGADRASGRDPFRQTRASRRLLVCVRRVVIGAILALTVGMLLTHPGRVAMKTVLLLPELLPDPPFRPLLWVTSPPRHEEHGYDSAVGHVDFDLYLPSSKGKHGSVILYTGAFGLRSDPSFVQFAEALARSGAVVMVPESAALRAGEILPGEVDALRQALAYLRGRPEVDAARVGVFGFSAGGSLVLLAAEDEVAREQIAFLNIFGSYYDAPELLLAVASHEIDAGGRRRSWRPDDVTVYTFAKQLIAPLPDADDRDILARAYLERQPQALDDLNRLSPDGLLVRELFERPSRERAAAILEELPQSSRDRLTAISPSNGVSRLKARLYLVHGREDGHIPVTHARDLAMATSPGTLRRYTETDLFVHVMPKRDLDTSVLALELLKLCHHAWLVGQEYL